MKLGDHVLFNGYYYDDESTSVDKIITWKMLVEANQFVIDMIERDQRQHQYLLSRRVDDLSFLDNCGEGLDFPNHVDWIYNISIKYNDN